jgi:hypothetical protein
MTPQHLAALEQKLATLQQQRALLDQPSASIEGGTSTSLQALESRLAALKEKRAQLDKEDVSPSLWDRVKQIGGGIASGVYKAGVGHALADPYVTMAQRATAQGAEDAEAYQKMLHQAQQEQGQQEAQELEGMDALGRILHKTGDWVGSGAATPLPGAGLVKGAVTLPMILKNMGKGLVKDTAVGATSGFLQEGGVNPMVADLSATLAPLAGKAVVNTPRWVFSPEYRQQVARPGAEKEVGSILRETVIPEGELTAERLHDAAHQMNVGQQISPLDSHQVLEGDTGNALRQFLIRKVDDLKKKRTQKTAPLYKQLEQVEEGLDPVQGEGLIDQKLRTAKGNVRTHLEKTKKELQANQQEKHPQQPALSPEDRKAKEDFLKAFMSTSERPEMVEKVKQQLGLTSPESLKSSPKPQEIDNTLKWLGDEIVKASKAGENSLARELTEVKKALERDLETIPQGRNYRKTYGDLSKPINEITQHRTIGNMVYKDPVTGVYKLSDSEIPSKIISTSLKSVDNAKDLMKHLKGKRGESVRKALEGTIHKDVLEAITNEHGKVSTAKIHTWKKNHPGTFILYPPLEKKLENLANAQYFTDQIMGKSRNLPLLEAYESLPLHLFKKTFRKIPGGGKLVEWIQETLGSEKNALRQELLEKALKDPVTAKILMTPVREEGKLWQYLQQSIKTGVRVTTGKRE